MVIWFHIYFYYRCQELEAELLRVKAECEALRTRASIPSEGASSMISSVAKVVQPTATVSSVPVSGPSKLLLTFIYQTCTRSFQFAATGIAQSVTPGQALRQTATSATTTLTAKVKNIPKFIRTLHDPTFISR